MRRPVLNNSLLGKLGRALGHRAAGIRSGILTMAALGTGTWGAFTVSFGLGLVAVALSCLTLDWWLSADRPAAPR